MAKKRKVPKSNSKPKVNRVKLTPDTVLLIEAPKKIIPAIVPHPERNAVEIVPVPVTPPGKSWWRSLFQ